MISKRILALDMSTKTGWSVLVSNEDSTFELKEYGKVKAIHQPEGPYPKSMIDWAYACFSPIHGLITKYNPDAIIIEETASGSKSIESQKILEYLHFLVAQHIVAHNIEVIYLLTEQWRRIVGCQMTKDEKLHNKKVKKSKEGQKVVINAETQKVKAKIAYDENGKRIGKITRKHVNVRRANEVFEKFLKEPLKMKDEDTADSLLLGYAYHVRWTKKDVL